MIMIYVVVDTIRYSLFCHLLVYFPVRTGRLKAQKSTSAPARAVQICWHQVAGKVSTGMIAAVGIHKVVCPPSK